MTLPDQLIKYMMDDDASDDGPLITENDLHWAICSRCKGDGFLRGYPGVYTSDDFDEDPELLEGYLEHRRNCDDCDGLGRVRCLSFDALARPAVDAYIQEWYDDERVSAQERAMGA